MTTENSTPDIPALDTTLTDDGVTHDEPLRVANHGEPIVTRWELWSYYLYLNGTIEVSLYYTTIIFQSLATAAGYDPVRGPGSSCLDSGASGKCVLPWRGRTNSVSSIVLLANGLSFATMTIALTVVGPAADYGSFGRWPLLVASLGYWGSMFATMSLTSPSRWVVATGIYIIGNVSYGLAVAFYSAIFPRLARNTTRSRELRKRYNRNEISKDEYEKGEALEKSKISSLSMTSAAVGGTIMLLLSLVLLVLLKEKTRANNYVIVLSTAYGVITCAWWFIVQQPRPGPKIPKGEHYLTIGWRQIWISLNQYKKLPNTFIYLIAYFLLADGQNTTMTLVHICQNIQFGFSFKQSTYLGIVQGASSIVGIIGYYCAQRYWRVDAKKMLIITSAVGVMVPLWGMIGIRTNKIGFHNRWEFWVYNVMFGFSQAPNYSFSQTVMSELSPPGFDFMFFGLYGLTGRASSIVGPIVIQAIINKTDNNWHGFPFLFAISLAATLIICLAVDVPTGRHDAERWAVDKRGTAYDVYSA